MIQTLTSALDERVPAVPAERYDLPGAPGSAQGAAQAIPGTDCFPGCPRDEEERMLEEAMRGFPDRADQVRPQVLHGAGPRAGPSGGDIPNLGERRTMEALEDECRFNLSKVQKIRRLGETYGHWRPIRGDGNCFYRTFIFGALEAFLARGDTAAVERTAETLQQVKYETPGEARAHADMLRRLRSCSTPGHLERWVLQDDRFDQALIRGCRRLVRLFLLENAQAESPSGLTYADLIQALDPTYTSVEAFCENVVDPMGRDAETLACSALPLKLGIGLRLWILDRRDDVDLVNVETPDPAGKVQVHALFKPGHYDLLYPREAASLAVDRGARPPADAGATEETGSGDTRADSGDDADEAEAGPESSDDRVTGEEELQGEDSGVCGMVDGRDSAHPLATSCLPGR